MNNWKETTLGEVAKNVSRRFNFLNREKVVFVNTGDVLEGKFLHSNYSSSKGLPGQAKKAIRKGDILFSEIRPANKRFALVDFEANDYVVSTKFMVISGNGNLNPKFLYQYLTCRETLQEFQVIAESRSGTFPQITFDSIAHYPIPFPPIEEQKEIAGVLSSLDDKIELLRKQNETLEKIAQAIFKRWFVEFNFPDENGKPYKESGGKMIESELGKIPEGWRVGFLDELIKESIPGEWGKEKNEDDFIKKVTCIRGTDIPNIRLGNESKAPERFIKEEKFQRCGIVAGDIIIEISGGTEGQSTGRAIYINKEILNRFEYPLVCVNFCRVLRPRKISYMYFSYLLLDYLYRMGVFFNLENGTTGIKNLDIKSLLGKFDIVLPPDIVLETFNDVIQNNFVKIQINNSQIQTLSRLRDALLPKFMSGKIEFKEIHEERSR